MLGIKLIHVSKKDPNVRTVRDSLCFVVILVPVDLHKMMMMMPIVVYIWAQLHVQMDHTNNTKSIYIYIYMKFEHSFFFLNSESGRHISQQTTAFKIINVSVEE